MEAPSPDPTPHDTLRDVVRACPWLMRVLRTVRDVGAVRDLVWDVRFGPGGLAIRRLRRLGHDVDVVGFDVDRVGQAHEHADAATCRRRVVRKRVPTRWPGVRVVW